MKPIETSQAPSDPEVVSLLEKLRPVPSPDPASVAHGRAAFLEQARTLAPTVSPAVERRHKGWMYLFIRKEPLKMSTLASVLLILTLLFGGSGATAYAAQNSLPDQLLYPVKLASEDLRSELTPSTQARLELALQFASRRAEEMTEMLQAGKQTPASLLARWQLEVDQALRLSAGLDNAQMSQSLQQVRQTLRAQEGDLNQVQASGQTEPVLLRARDMLQTRLQLVESGLADPQTFRARTRNGQFAAPPTTAPTGVNTPVPGTGAGTLSTGAGNPWTTGTPTPGSGYGSGNGGNPWTTGTPTPGSSYGPGPGDCTTCTPSGGGSGNPWTDTTPTPGSGYGPGPNPTSAPGMGTGPGPQSTPQQGATQGSGGGNNDGGGGRH